jgi:hypothetical protein
MEDITSHLKKFIEQDVSDLRKYSRQGEIDGKKDIPASDATELSTSEVEIISEADQAWTRFKTEVSNTQQKIDIELERTKSEIEGEISVTIDKISDDRNSELDLLEAEYGTSTSEYKNLKKNYESAEEELMEIRRTVNRSIQVNFVHTYILFMSILALAEVPVNRLAFELFFEQSPIISLILSAAVGALFVFFAHVIGSQIKYAQCVELNPDKKKIYSTMAALFLMSLLVMYFLGVMREQLVAVQNSANMSLEDMLNDESQAAVTNGMTTLVLGSKGLMLLLLNLAIYVSGVILAYFRHDAHPIYEQVVSKFEKSKNAFLKYQKRFEVMQVEKLREFNDKHSFNKSLQRKREASIESINRNRESLRRIEEDSKLKLHEAIISRIRAYRENNKKFRLTQPPMYFEISMYAQVEERIR